MVLLISCGIVPTWLSVGTTALDVGLQVETGKTSSEHVVSHVTKEDCRWSRILYGASICMNEKEHIEYLLSMNCETYAWNWMGQPYCKE